MRVVLANEPRYEREVLAAALRQLRPAHPACAFLALVADQAETECVLGTVPGGRVLPKTASPAAALSVLRELGAGDGRRTVAGPPSVD